MTSGITTRPFDVQTRMTGLRGGAGSWRGNDLLSGLMLGAAMAAPLLGLGAWVLRQEQHTLSARHAELENRWHAHEQLVSAPPAPTLGVEHAAHGRDLFLMTCAACHNPGGTGLEGLGKDLTRSWFLASLDDAAARDFLKKGRPTARPSPMPPRGGNESLTDDDLASIVVYLRGLQDPRRLPELPPPRVVVAEASEAEKAAALAAAGGDAELAEYIASGNKLFAATCAACHGKDARGLPDKGKDLTTSEFARGLDDDALLEFLKRGRDPGDARNTTGVAMPPKGGNPALSEDDLLDIIEYVRSLQKATER